MPTALVILPTATYRAPDFIEAAAEMGIDLVVASEAGHALGEQMGDGFVEIDCDDPDSGADAIVELAARRPLDAVVAADDQGVVVAAVAAERLGLPHNPPAAAAATRDKKVMRRLLEDAGVPQPAFRVIAGDEITDLGFPVVVKPPGLSGSRGVIRCNDEAGYPAVVRRVRSILAEAGGDHDEPLIVEEYVEGEEAVVEGLLGPDGLEVLAVLDKPDPLVGPYFEETMFVTPSRLAAADRDAVEEAAEQAVAAIGLTFGPVHAELRVRDGRASVVEIAARSIGGLCGRSLRFGLLGVSLEQLLLRAALGLPRRGMRRAERAGGAMMLPIPREGILRRVGWQEAAMEVPGITGLEITIPIGQRVVPLPEGSRYLGFLFAAADDPEQVEAALREAHDLLDVVIEP